MAIITPTRLFLDSWVLKRLARGQYQDSLGILRQLIEGSAVTLVVTWDHVDDYCADVDRQRAETEAAFVDTLKPLWMPQGQAIYHIEAYAEFCRLTLQSLPAEPFPCQGPAEAILQWWRHCPLDEGVASFVAYAPTYDVHATFLREVQYVFDDYLLGWGPTRNQTLTRLGMLSDNRVWARNHRLDWDKHFRIVLNKHLSATPFSLPPDQVSAVVENASLDNMPAWKAFLETDKAWHKGKAKAKRSDTLDRYHIAVLPYVDYFVTEGHLASLTQQARLACKRAKVYDNLKDCLAELRGLRGKSS
jgi:hypothetical protein